MKKYYANKPNLENNINTGNTQTSLTENLELVSFDKLPITNINIEKYRNYNLDLYKHDIYKYGLKQTWHYLNYIVLNFSNLNSFLNVDNLAELYELGLSLENKQNKKNNGQYYTPDDVARVMASWLKDLNGKNICDVACGTGKLILTYLKLIGEDSAINVIKSGSLYLYDSDETALSICKTILMVKYGVEYRNCIHDINCDFLSKNIVLPRNCKVISNPPYVKINHLLNDWDENLVSFSTKEMYAMFIEKIIKQSSSAVIISPYSFISAKKFYPIRKLMNNYNGFIISFDNVPGNIFCGKKHGIFNTNTSNSVRAAITIVQNKENFKGFKLTPLIRFKNVERKDLLNKDILESFIDKDYQIIDKNNTMYCKCAKELKEVWVSWKKQSSKCLCDLIDVAGKYIISMPNTCRYYTTASNTYMKRNGQIILHISDKDVFNYVFCLINSSFAYWYWRLFDGGITYQRSLLLSMPVFYDLITDEDKDFFNSITNEMIEIAPKYIIKKNNVGIQENIKYPREFRDKINSRMIDILGLDIDVKMFDIIHSNMALEINV